MRRRGRYARSLLARGLTRLPVERRRRLQPLLGDRDLLVTGFPPASGLALRGLPIDHVQAWGLVRGVVEPGVQEALRRHVGPGTTVWDVGANVGFFTLLAARLGGDVQAFEPVPATARRLRANVAANGFGERVRVHEQAVAARSGRAAFLLVEDASWSHLADRGRHPRTRARLEVPVVALDDLDLPLPDVIKVDVEGSELAVLEGARRLLADHAPLLVVELHATNAEVCDLLEPLGYEIENLDGPEPPREAGPVHVLARRR